MAQLYAVDQFNDELQSLFNLKPPVSKAKMTLITRAAMRGLKYYKHIVQSVERFISKCSPEYKVPGLYVIDSIVRQSIHQFRDRDVYAGRFARNLQKTFTDLFYNCIPDDKPRMLRVLNLWLKNNVFGHQTIQPILDMADQDLSHSRSDPQSADSPSYENPNLHDQNEAKDIILQNLSETVQKRSHQDQIMSKSEVGGTSGGIKFNKSILGFDYDDDDDDGDETPTEAEPPLSTTLGKIDIDHRKRSSYSNKYAQRQGSSRQPVLERWNQLMGQDDEQDYDNAESHPYSRSRSRSRSPDNLAQTYSKSVDKHSGLQVNSQENDIDTQMTQEKINERKRKGFPDMRRGFLTICSTTLWLGHVPKTVSEADISDAFGEYGSITSIDLIPPRGCAYVCMDRRQDALKALQESRSLKLNGSHIKMAWAPGKGLKDKKFKDFWEVDVGASFIPVSNIDDSLVLEALEEGGVLDEDTLTDDIRRLRDKTTDDTNLTNQIDLSILSQPPPPFPLPNLDMSRPPITGLPMPFTHLPILPLNQDSHHSPSHVDKMTRLSGPMISIPNPSLFHNPPPFNLPPASLLPIQDGSQPLPPIFANQQPLFNQHPPALPMQPHFNELLSPQRQDQQQGRDSVNKDETKQTNNQDMYSSISERLAPQNFNSGSQQQSNMRPSSPRPYGRLLPQPGQTDLYPNIDSSSELKNPPDFNNQQQSSGSYEISNGDMMNHLMSRQIPSGYIRSDSINQFDGQFNNAGVEMINPAFANHQPMPFNYDNQFDRPIIDDQQNNSNRRNRQHYRQNNRNKRRR